MIGSNDQPNDLIARGFSVFPITPRQKFPPLIKDWPAQATNHTGIIARWRTQYPKANWGIHCRGLLVVDVDAAKDGYATLTEYEMTRGLPDTLTASTPSGGLHLFYRYAPGVRNSVQKLGPGLDVRSTGGYVVGAGSSVDSGGYTWHCDTAIADAPEWLVKACDAAPPAKEKATREMPEGVNVDAAVERAREWLKTREPAVEGHGGDAHTYATCAKLRDFGVPLDLVQETLTDWNDTCVPPWEADELQRKAENAYNYGRNAPAELAVETEFDVVEETPPSPVELKDPDLYGPLDVTLEDVLRNDYLVKGWLDRGSKGLMFGRWGSGKTFNALHMAVHIAAGKQWFGRRTRQGGVLYFGYEGDVALRRRVYALREEFPDWPWKHIPFRLRPMNKPLVKKNATSKLVGQEQFERAIRVFKKQTGAYPALIIIDPLRNALQGSDSDADLTTPFLNYLTSISKSLHCATLTLHHPGHSDADRARGDSGIEADMDTVIRVDGELGCIVTTKQRDESTKSLYYRLETVNLGVDSDGDARTTCVVRQVQNNDLDPTLTDKQRQVMDYLRERADDDGMVTRSLVRDAGRGFSATVRNEIVRVLEKKRFLISDGQKYKIGEGPQDIFS